MSSYWGIDLGGTKIEGVVLHKMSPEAVICRIRIPTERENGYSHILDRIALLVQKMEMETGKKADQIGFATPGVLDPPSQRMKNCNTTELNDQALKSDLEKRLGIPVRLANDANCFALAETKMGIVPQKIPNPQCIFGTIMGTGVGGGLVINGEIWEGLHGIGGEWGHNFLDESGGPCYCGKKGCVETILSGPACEQYYKEISGKSLSLAQIVELYQLDLDPNANACVERLIHFFGKAIAPIINILDPEAIVLGGGLGNIPFLYTEGKNEVRKHLFNNTLNTAFLKPKLGDSAGVFGAAMLWA